MKGTLTPGDTHHHTFTVTDAETVPNLYPDSQQFRNMPRVFATGYLVGLIEWACMAALKDHLNEGEGSLGTAISVTHVAPTPPGMRVDVTVTCASIKGHRIEWKVRAEDEGGLIGEGTHQRTVVLWDRFNRKVAEKERGGGGSQRSFPIPSEPR
jgi:fluoroacetyl-CoA thioesterase